MNIKKHLSLHLFTSTLIIFAILISPFDVSGEEITYPFFSVQSNNYLNKSNTLESFYNDNKIENWLQNAIDTCKKNAPPYFAPYWNWRWWIKNSTNCYAYAFDITKNPITGENFLKNIGLQPGSICGEKICANSYDGPIKSNKRLVDIISMDMAELGYVFIEAKADVTIPDKAYMVALSIFPGNEEYTSDYHWYRLNSDGTWSHKPGFDSVTNMDKSGSVITDPLTANRGLYNCFVGYFYVVK
jgi:hypothetical protein